MKKIYAIICTVTIAFSSFCNFSYAQENDSFPKYSYKMSLENDSEFQSSYGYSGGTIAMKKSYVAGKYGNALQITYPGHLISDAAKRYNGYVLNFKTDAVEVGNEQLTMLDIMRTSENLSMWVKTPVVSDHGNGIDLKRTIEFIFEYNTKEGSKKYSKKFQLPNRGDWEYITLPVSYFTSGDVTMADGIQGEEYESLARLTISFPYKDYFGANPDESTLETPWEEPLAIDEILFDRSTEEEKAVIPPSTGEEEYHENANIESISVNGVKVADFDPSKTENTVYVPANYNAEQIINSITVGLAAPEIEKTNTNQGLSGASYTIEAPDSVPGKGTIKVTSASGKIKKNYSISFAALSGIQVNVTEISSDGGKMIVPVSNESASGGDVNAVVIAVSKDTNGVAKAAAVSAENSIAPGTTVDFELNIDESNNTEIYVVNNENEYKLLCAPVRTDGESFDYKAPGGTIGGCDMSISENSLNINAGVTGSGSILTVLKNESGYIGAYLSEALNGSASYSIPLGDNAKGSLEAYVSYGNVTSRKLYYASESELESCVSEFNALGGGEEECAAYFEKYKNVLSIADLLSGKLTSSDIARAISKTEKNSDSTEEIRKRIGEAMISEAVADSNSPEVISDLYHNYNDIAGFNTISDCFVKYITESKDLEKVIELTGKNSYSSVDDMRKGFERSVLIVSFSKTSSYGQIGEIIEANEQLLSEYINYGDLNKLSSSQKAEYYKYVSEKNSFSSLDSLGDYLDEYLRGKHSGGNSGGSGSNGGGGMWAPPVSVPEGEKPSATETPQSNAFSDLTSSHWAYSSILGLKNIGIVNGREDGSFGVDDAVTREEFVKMLVGVFGIETGSSEGKFSDVDSSAWYAPYVNTAAELGIVSGIDENTFGTGRRITRQDMTVLIVRAMEKQGIEITGGGAKFEDDSDIADYANESVYALRNLGLINGVEENMFKPLDEATRAQTAKILYSVYSYIKNSGNTDIDISGDDPFSVRARKFRALGIVDTVMNETEIVTKAQFAKYIAELMNASFSYSDGAAAFADVTADHKYYSEIRYLKELGVISNTENFEPDSAITYGQAAVMICRVLGYDVEAVRNGGNTDDYLRTALEHDLIEPLNKNIDEGISFGEVLELFDTAIEANMMTGSIVGNKSEYSESETTLLYYFHKISVCEGIVSVSGMRSLYDNASLSDNGIMIGSSSFTSEYTDAYKYLGYNVKAYYTDDNAVMFVAPEDNNEVLVIDGDLISEFNGTTITYFKDKKSSSTKKETLSKSVNRMYNYNYVSEYTDDDVKKAEEIILIDSNDDGEYDTVNVMNEVSYCVSQISSYDGSIYGYLNQMSVKTEDADSVIVYDENGNLVSVSAIQTNDVISVAADKKNENYIIHISRVTIDGTVDSVSADEDDFIVTVDGTEYSLTDEFAAENTTKGYLAPGNGIKAYVDRRMKIAYVELNDEISENSYAYLVKAVFGEPGVDPFLRLYTTGGELLDIKFASGAVVNGTKIKENTDLNKLFSETNINIGSVNQLIRYKLNDKGELKQVQTAQYVKGSELYTSANIFTRGDDMKDIYYNATYNNFPGYVRINKDTVIMYVPQTQSMMSDVSYYGIQEFRDLKSSTFDGVEVYNLSKDMTAGIIVVRSDNGGGTQLTYSSPITAIKKITETAVDGETRYTLTLLYNGAEYEYTLADGVDIAIDYKGADGNPVTSVLDEGDLIRIATNSNDEITDYHKVFDFDNEDDPSVVIRGNEYTNKKTYIGSSKTMIAFNGTAADPETDVVSGRIWQGKNPYWFTGVQYSTEFGIVKSIHGTTMIVETYGGTAGSNSLSCERLFNLKNNRVYILEDGKDGVRLGSCADIIPSELAGDANASRVIISRHNDVPSIAAVVNR